jgi:hypothetical protein
VVKVGVDFRFEFGITALFPAILLLQFCYKPYPAICFIKIEKPLRGFFPRGF